MTILAMMIPVLGAGFCAGALLIMIMSDMINGVEGSWPWYLIMAISGLSSAGTAFDLWKDVAVKAAVP